MNDAAWMRRAIEQARMALGRTAPNPSVGAVIVRDGEIVGEGFTQPVGGPHAEIVAIQTASGDLRGATMYVTLEPCCHHGRTPPCTDAVLAAGIARVVVGVVDPYPEVQGRGLELLREAGVEVTVGVLAKECADLVLGFARVMIGGLPEVTCKAAVSLDGHIATAAGESQWITGQAARNHGHGLRASHDAIVVGVDTAVADNPRLTCRTEEGRDPVPVVLDTRGRLPADARLLHGPRRALVFYANDVPAPALDADLVAVPRSDAGLDLTAVLAELGRRGLHRVLVEGGGRVHRSLIDRDLVDHVMLYLAPIVIPGGRSWIGGDALPALAGAARFERKSMIPLGDDVLLHYCRRSPE